jgi:hypothetical protein
MDKSGYLEVCGELEPVGIGADRFDPIRWPD